jgi:hypothetical protein
MLLQQVHLRINDAATGQPTPVRLRITDADGTYYAPYGRLTEFATGVNLDVGGNVQIGAKKWAYIDGACEILLPPGTLHVEVTKGPEYKPIDEEITLLPGKMSLRLTIERWSDVRTEGWYSGDTRVHYLSPDAALLEGQAEDVAVVNLLVIDTVLEDRHANSIQQTVLESETWARFQELIEKAIDRTLTPEETVELRFYARVSTTFAGIIERLLKNKGARSIPQIVSFSGQSFARQNDRCGVAVNTFNRNIDIGTLGLLHCHRVVYPLVAGDPEDEKEWTLRDWCGQCHRKKGLVVWANSLGLVKPSAYGEPLADLILGEVDAFEMQDWEDVSSSDMAYYYSLCDAELVVPLVAASAKQDNHGTIGAMRTYAYLPSDQPFTYTNWIEAVRAGRTFVSNGPLLHLTIDGIVPTTTLTVSAGPATLQIRATAKSWAAFERLELMWNGEVCAESGVVSGEPYLAALEHELTAGGSGYLTLRCHGKNRLAHSSAVAVRRADAPGWAQPTAVQRLLDELDAMLSWAKEKTRDRLCQVLEEARTILAKKLSA